MSIVLGAEAPASAAKERVEEIVAELQEAESNNGLEPTPKVNTLFSQLVRLALNSTLYIADSLSSESRRLSAIGEAKMEGHWSDLIADKPDCVNEFPYTANYVDMIGAETSVLDAMIGNRVLFVGSGPLPLSAIELQRAKPDWGITCLDSDSNALWSGKKVAEALGFTGMNWLVDDIFEPESDLSSYDAIVIAALVGKDQDEKDQIIETVGPNMKPESILAIRSIPKTGTRQLLYPGFEWPGSSGFEYLGATNPPAGVINNLVIARTL